MFQAKVSKKTILGGVLKILFRGVVYTPDEDGEVTIQDTPFIVEQSEITGGRELDKTWQEIRDQFASGVPVLVTTPAEWGGESWTSVVSVANNVSNFSVLLADGWEWTCYEANEKPHHFLD